MKTRLLTAEILNQRERRRITLNYALKQAVIGSSGLLWSPPASRPRPVPAPEAPRGWTVQSQDSVDLGTKTFGALTLHGQRDTVVFSGRGAGQGVQRIHTFEVWDYRFRDRSLVPVIVELRIETPDDVDDQHITRVTTTRVPHSTFEIPADFTLGQPVRTDGSWPVVKSHDGSGEQPDSGAASSQEAVRWRSAASSTGRFRLPTSRSIQPTAW